MKILITFIIIYILFMHIKCGNSIYRNDVIKNLKKQKYITLICLSLLFFPFNAQFLSNLSIPKQYLININKQQIQIKNYDEFIKMHNSIKISSKICFRALTNYFIDLRFTNLLIRIINKFTQKCNVKFSKKQCRVYVPVS